MLDVPVNIPDGDLAGGLVDPGEEEPKIGPVVFVGARVGVPTPQPFAEPVEVG